MTSNKTVLISGASIAGPALAYWLNRYGYAVTVVEKAPALRSGGQAVDFKGATHLQVLERMGVLDDIYRRQTGKTDVVIVDAEGAKVAEMPGDWLGGDVEILRGDLAEILVQHTAEDCEYLFNDSVTSLTDTGDGVRVTFEKAAPRTFDLVFGADGIHSRVRRCAFGPEADYVIFNGYYYAIAGAPGLSGLPIDATVRGTAYSYNEPGRAVTRGGSKANQMYVFASPELDYARNDIAQQQDIVRREFATVGWQTPEMLATLDSLDDFYLDSLSRVDMKSYYSGRVALVGDAAYGNTLGGFGTGLAIVGAYVLAGELAAAGGDHVRAFARYDKIMHGYAKAAGHTNAGGFLCPKTPRGLRMRNRLLNSKLLFGSMVKVGDWFAKNIDLVDYSAAASQSTATV